MVESINKKENIFNDNIAFIEQWDFSRANLNEQNRINAITQVASICYQNPKALNSESLYNRLLAESQGLPSSSFEFVPVLIPRKNLILYTLDRLMDVDKLNMVKFGEYIIHKGTEYLLTNFRAVVYDYENSLNNCFDLRKHFNTEEECKIIAKHFKVFNYKVDLPTRSQMVRHRVSWQELSRRYVSGERVPFEFYVSEKMKNVISVNDIVGSDEEFSTQKVIDICLTHYYASLESGTKPQEARRIIPQCAYTQIWGAFMPSQLDNYMKLRLDSHSQWEIQQTAKAMQELIKEINEK